MCFDAIENAVQLRSDDLVLGLISHQGRRLEDSIGVHHDCIPLRGDPQGCLVVTVFRSIGRTYAGSNQLVAIAGDFERDAAKTLLQSSQHRIRVAGTDRFADLKVHRASSMSRTIPRSKNLIFIRLAVLATVAQQPEIGAVPCDEKASFLGYDASKYMENFACPVPTGQVTFKSRWFPSA